MPTPASNDPVDPDAIGGSEQDIHRASLAIRWLAIAALAVALSLFYVLSASAGELVGRVVSIADGDTLTILVDRTQIKIRLTEIDSPERKQPFYARSRESLAELCANKDARVVEQGKDRNRRTLGRVFCEGVDTSAEQVKRGMAMDFDRYVTDRSLYAVQDEARAAKRGLWADPNPIPPWSWREQNRKKKS